jgi:hypothetical protein
MGVAAERAGNSYCYQHINQNNILTTEQYGFRNNSSTEKAPFKLINEILLAFNNKLTVGGILCALEKAFDSVNHDILYSVFFHSVHPVTDMTWDTSSSVYILYSA